MTQTSTATQITAQILTAKGTWNGPYSADITTKGNLSYPHTTHIARIIERYTETPGQWISLSWIREDAGLIRSDFDAAMTELAKAQAVTLVPEDNQKTLDASDHEATLLIGGEEKHLVCLG